MNALQHALAQPLALWLLVLLPVLGILALLARRWGRRALWQFSGGLSALTPPSTLGRDGRLRSWRRALRTYGASTGLAFLALGIAGPQWGRDRDQSLTPGRDLVVVLDMSLSMLARDVPGPTSDSRLGQAVAALQDLANAAEKRGGHRLALVVFASRAKVVCPLTQDYDHFREGLGQLDPLDPLLEIGPVEDSGSGTRIGSALLESVKLLREAPSPGYQDILLLSDGDDPAQDEEWRLGVEAARKDKIPIHTIGLGDPSRPSLIPIPGAGDLRYHGQLITSRLEERPLEEIALRTRGTYTPARTSALPLADWLSTGRELREDSFPVFKQRYAWFLALALCLLAIPLGLSEVGSAPRPVKNEDRRSRIEDRARVTVNPHSSILDPQSAMLLSFFAAVFLIGASPTSDAENLLERGNLAFGRGEYETALGYYRQAEGRIGDPGLLAFNEGATLYKLGRYREAEIHYWLSRQDAAGDRLTRVLYDLGNAVFQQAGSRDAPLLQRAIAFYEECLSHADADPDLLLNARFNLELARERLKRAKAAKENPSDEPKGSNKPEEDLSSKSQPPEIGAEAGLESDAGPGRRVAEGAGAENATDSQSAKRQGGIGNLPPVPDTDQLVPLTSLDTSAYLRKTAERILHEHRAYYGKSATRPSQNLKDW
jgi:Ca-activated chloride channel family protein